MELVEEEEGRDEEDGLDPVVEVRVSEAADEDWRVESCVGNAEVVGVATVVVSGGQFFRGGRRPFCC
jgi:hypothetical protein